MQIRRIIISNQAFIRLIRFCSFFIVSLFLLSSCATPKPDTPEKPFSILPVTDSRQLPGVIVELLRQADTQYQQENFSSSLATLERAVRINPRYPEVWSRMAQVYLQQGKIEQARQHAKRSNSYIKNNALLQEFNNNLIISTKLGPLN